MVLNFVCAATLGAFVWLLAADGYIWHHFSHISSTNLIFHCNVAMLGIHVQPLLGRPNREAIEAIARHRLDDFWIEATMASRVSKKYVYCLISHHKDSLTSVYRFCWIYIVLTKEIATRVATGTTKQINATFRQAVKLPSRNTKNRPNVAAMPAIAINIPRIDG